MSIFYISTGEKKMMYTLREQWKESVEATPGNFVDVIYDVYHRNLSIDKKTAIKVAMVMGYFVESPKFDLAEIQRSKERVDKAKLDALIAAREEERRLVRQRIEKQQLDRIADDKWPFGEHKNKHIGDVVSIRGIGYAVWWVYLAAQKTGDVVLTELAKYLTANFKRVSNVVTAPEPVDQWYDEPRTTHKSVPVTLIKHTSFDGQWGLTFIQEFLTEDGKLLLYMGGSPRELTLGDQPKINFVVKDVGKYDGKYQTKIKNVKVV